MGQVPPVTCHSCDGSSHSHDIQCDPEQPFFTIWVKTGTNVKGQTYPSGEECYPALVRSFVTMKVPAEQIHADAQTDDERRDDREEERRGGLCRPAHHRHRGRIACWVEWWEEWSGWW